MPTKVERVTDKEIASLAREAAEAGDREMVKIAAARWMAARRLARNARASSWRRAR